MHRVTFHEAGKMLGLTYESIRRRAQIGTLEAAEPLDGVQSVSYRSVAILGAQINHPIADAPSNVEQFEALRADLTNFHLQGVQRAAFLSQLEADALQAEHGDDLPTACVYWQLIAGLSTASYGFNRARGTWTVDVPGIGQSETMTAPPAPAEPSPVGGDAS